MTNEEAKELYINAVKAFESKDFEGALAAFDQLDAQRPNSRHVTYHRVVCLANLGRKHEARSSLEKVDGKLEGDKMAELKRLLAADTPPPAHPAPSPADYGTDPAAGMEVSGDNVLAIESAFSKTTDETTITGHVKSGTFRTGDSLTIVTPDGMPIVAPVLRIGTSETPIKMARAGQKVIMLLQVEAHYVVPGSSATCMSQEESYAETMVVGITDDAEPASSASMMDSTLMELDRQIRGGKYEGVLDRLHSYLVANPGSCASHRLTAKVYLEGGDGLRDPAKALEHGLRFLERLFAGTREFEAKGALGQRIIDFRNRHQLGHVWEFSDAYGDVIFESGDIQEIARAIKSNTVPVTSLCKKDRVGEWRKVEETIALEHDVIGALFKKERAGSGSSTMIYVIIGLLAAIIVAVLFIFMGGSGEEVSPG